MSLRPLILISCAVVLVCEVIAATSPALLSAARRRNSTSSYSPGTETNIYNWIRADDLALSNNDLVATWVDQTAGARNWVQTTDSKKPTFKTSQFASGLPSVSFNGTTNRIVNTSSLNGGNSFTVFYLAKLGTVLGSDNKTVGLYDSASGSQDTFRFYNLGNYIEIWNEAPRVSIGTLAAGAITISVTATADGVNRTLLVYTNGIQVASATSSAGNSIAWLSTQMIGAVNDGGAGFYEGGIGEFYILKPAATLQQITNGHAYLKARGGL